MKRATTGASIPVPTEDFPSTTAAHWEDVHREVSKVRKLETQIKKSEAKQQQTDAQQRFNQSKQDIRRTFIVGTVVIKFFKLSEALGTGPLAESCEELLDAIDADITRDDDRALFNLPPLTNFETRIKQSKIKRRPEAWQRSNKSKNTRRTFIVGTVILNSIARGAFSKELLLIMLDRNLTSADDRDLFNLPPV